MQIVHIGKMGNIEKEGIITQNIYKYCRGKHKYHSVYDSNIPLADIYILHCFRNDYKYFVEWQKKYEHARVISLIHSYEPCMPNKNSDVIVTITKTWQKYLKDNYNIDSEMIYPGIDLKPFEKVKLNLDKKVIGRISRLERGKYHPEWNYIILSLLDKYKELTYRLISNKYYRLPIIKHKRAKYIEGVKIDQIKKKVKELSKLSIYIDAHDNFIETFSLGLLEAMACGLPVILLGKGQEAMSEVLGYAGINAKTIESFNSNLIYLLENEKIRKKLSECSKKRAKEFSLDKFVKQWDELLIKQYAKVKRWL